MTLDELDLAGVSERVVTAARRAAQPWTEAWVVSQGDEAGLLLHTGTGLSWFFPARVWTAAWHAVDDVVSLDADHVSVRRSGGEIYRFGFRDIEQVSDFLALAAKHCDDPPPPSGTASSPADTRRTLTTMVAGGLLGTFIGAVMAALGDETGAQVFGLFLVTISQVALWIGLIGWGVVLGIRASRD